MTGMASVERSEGPGRLVLRSQELADLAGTTPRALRHYHRLGLLPEADRDPNGYRRYGPRDLVRVLRIRQLAASGMPLRSIGEVLDRDAGRQAAALDELEAALAEQAALIERQRAVIAELRAFASAGLAAGSPDGPTPSRTQGLDADLWTLATASGAIDAASATAVAEALSTPELAELSAGWHPEFEALESADSIDTATADDLAERLAAFATALAAAAGLDASGAAEGAAPDLGPIVEQLQAEALSPAQLEVWRRFVERMA